LYGGYYFDITICPEFKYEHKHQSFILKGETVIIDNQPFPVLDNGIMYFKDKKNNFLKSAIYKSVDNILNHNYGRHPLDITGPMMLYGLDHSDIIKFPCSITNNKKTVKINEKDWFIYHNGFSATYPFKYGNESIIKHGSKGTNSYSKLWLDKNVFKGAKHRND
jgi:hypothetical protein